MEEKKEKVRVIEAGPEDFDDPDLRDLVNNNVRIMNKLNQAREEFSQGKITITEHKKIMSETESERKEVKRKLREYKKRNK